MAIPTIPNTITVDELDTLEKNVARTGWYVYFGTKDGLVHTLLDRKHKNFSSCHDAVLAAERLLHILWNELDHLTVYGPDDVMVPVFVAAQGEQQ